MKSAWLNRLEHDGVVLIDGGTGSELRRRGFPMRDDAWSALASVSHYELLREIHVDYVRAGADVITTNTFSTARFVLDAAGLRADFDRINRRAVQAAREARDLAGREIAIAGSLSCLPPRFDVHAYPDPHVEAQAYVELVELLAESGVDLIALEMMQQPQRARLACNAARGVGLPFWLGVSCRLSGTRLVLFDFPDTTLEECLDAALPYEPSVVNVMHTPLDAIEPALRFVRTRWSGHMGAYPELSDAHSQLRDSHSQLRDSHSQLRDSLSHLGDSRLERRGERQSPAALASAAPAWIALGARVIGGCCGTTPDHIRALREVVGP